jgi:RHS repeat-associated protein
VLLAQKEDTWAYHLNDGLSSVRQLADEDGTIILARSCMPFGEPLWSAGSGTTTYGFTGEQWGAYTGLLFLRARYCEPQTGRFLTQDVWPEDG